MKKWSESRAPAGRIAYVNGRYLPHGYAGVHIEDQLYPKRAHYHKYVARVIPRKEFADKIRLACRQRDQAAGLAAPSQSPIRLASSDRS